MKIISYKHVLTICLLSIGVQTASVGQEARALSLKEVLEQVVTNNWQIRMANQQALAAKADLMQANSTFLPTVSLSETYINTTDPMLAFGTTLGQSAITAADFNPDRLNDPDATENFATRVEVNQPIFNLDGIYGRQAAKAASEAASNQQSWSQELMVQHTKSLYYNMVLAIKGKATVEQAVQTAAANFQTAQDLFEQGLITNADLMGAELRHTQVQSQALQATHLVEDLNQRLLQLMGSEENTRIAPSDTMLYTTADVTALSMNTMETGRADLLAMERAAKAGELNRKSQQMGFVPRINAFGSYGFNDTQLFGDQADNYLLGVQLKWDVFQGGKQLGSAQKARYEAELANIALQEKQAAAKRDVMRLKNDLLLAEEHLKLAELAAMQAGELYSIRSDRFTEGLEKTADLLTAETNHLNKQLAVLQAKNTYVQLIFRLETVLAQDLTGIQ